MNNCDYCGEHKKVRKDISFSGNHVGGDSFLYLFDYICKECDEFNKILLIKKVKEHNIYKKKKQKEWIKKRDKFLECVEDES